MKISTPSILLKVHQDLFSPFCYVKWRRLLLKSPPWCKIKILIQPAEREGLHMLQESVKRDEERWLLCYTASNFLLIHFNFSGMIAKVKPTDISFSFYCSFTRMKARMCWQNEGYREHRALQTAWHYGHWPCHFLFCFSYCHFSPLK